MEGTWKEFWTRFTSWCPSPLDPGFELFCKCIFFAGSLVSAKTLAAVHQEAHLTDEKLADIVVMMARAYDTSTAQYRAHTEAPPAKEAKITVH